MTTRAETRGSTFTWIFAAGLLTAVIGLFGFTGSSAVSAQTDSTAPTVPSLAVTSEADQTSSAPRRRVPPRTAAG